MKSIIILNLLYNEIEVYVKKGKYVCVLYVELVIRNNK